MSDFNKENEKNLFSLWYNWLIGSGTLTLLVVLSLWVKPLVLPLVAFALQLALFLRIRHDRINNIPRCNLIIFAVSRVLFWSGVIMVALNWLYSDDLIYRLFPADTINPDIPYISSLIVYPVATIVCGWIYLVRKKINLCADCHMRFGTPVERGVFGSTLSYESNYQILFLFVLCLARAVIGWAYYGLRYINANINEPDRFFFIWAPALIWLAGAIYIGMRYIGLWGYYWHRGESSTMIYAKSTKLRYIMFWDNFVCLRPPVINSDSLTNPSDLKFDTPVSGMLYQRNNISTDEARERFKDLTGIELGESLRFMYANKSPFSQCHIYHYLCFLDDKQKETFAAAHPDYEWYSLHQIAQLINSGMLESMFCSEFIRLHTMAMAWKTYTSTGERRYKIKHYRPTFHLRDVHKWDIDYNDPLWLAVANNNADKPFFRLRRLWRRLINRIGFSSHNDPTQVK